MPEFFKVVGVVGCLFTGLIIAGTLDGAPMVRRWHQSDGERLEVTQAEPSAPSETTTGNGQGSEPSMKVGQLTLTRSTDGQASTFSMFYHPFSGLVLYI